MIIIIKLIPNILIEDDLLVSLVPSQPSKSSTALTGQFLIPYSNNFAF